MKNTLSFWLVMLALGCPAGPGRRLGGGAPWRHRGKDFEALFGMDRFWL